MKVRLEPANPLDHLDGVVALFARAGKRRSREHFEWYYEDKGFGAPWSWLLRDVESGAVVGLNSVVFRAIAFDGRTLTAGLSGNLLVDEAARRTMGAAQLMRVTQDLVARGRIDILLGIMPNAAGSAIGRAARFATIGHWRTCLLTRRSQRWLRARVGALGAALAAPAIDGGARLLRAVASRRRRAASPSLTVRRLGANELATLRCEEWQSVRDRFAVAVNTPFLVGQFGTYPGDPHELYAVYLEGAPAGMVALVRSAATGRLWVRFAAANRRLATTAGVIGAVVGADPGKPSLWRVEALEESESRRGLETAGFATVPRLIGPRLSLMGYWLAGHPLAAAFADPYKWDLFQGANDV